ncbi:lysophospholipid acyltransferase family protein [Sulfuriflexus sp.]|uniref:lysophospholipid acyltransferase family protein n=1 Tax=Sulfuriflexus sp. TaxID=2015443 RepID=UPI0028CC28BE|nr:lysophospholipid acyltransferase family protein [Sulfuriflexus sp.]MDT8404084.1 lysophospholipid acyltransferase family protein [Sulfuriflexus sp.]
MRLFRSLLFSAGMILITVFYAIPSTLGYFLPYRPRYRLVSVWHRAVLRWLELTCGIDYKVEGLENIPRDQAGIIFSRHESTWETLALTKIFPPQAWVLKRELLWIPFFGWALAVLEPIAIDRNAGRKAINQIIDQGLSRLGAGRWIVVFPEGTRLAPGQTKKFGVGGALLAARSGYPVLPVAHNAGEFWPKRGFLKKPGTIRIVIGKPIASKGRKAAEINAEAEQWINTTRARL